MHLLTIEEEIAPRRRRAEEGACLWPAVTASPPSSEGRYSCLCERDATCCGTGVHTNWA